MSKVDDIFDDYTGGIISYEEAKRRIELIATDLSNPKCPVHKEFLLSCQGCVNGLSNPTEPTKKPYGLCECGHHSDIHNSKNPFVCMIDECGDLVCWGFTAVTDSKERVAAQGENQTLRDTSTPELELEELLKPYRETTRGLYMMTISELKNLIHQAAIKELEHWLRMVTWPNNYTAMQESMKVRIKELKEIV